MATKFIKVVHPEAGKATVPESSLPHHMKAGWRRADEPETQDKPTRRRRTETESSEES